MGAVGVVLAMVGLFWRRLARDRMGLAFTFLAPIAVASVMVGIYTSQDPSAGYPVAVVADSRGTVGGEILRRLEANSVLDVRRYDDRDTAERAVRRRDVAAAVVVPAAVEYATGSATGAGRGAGTSRPSGEEQTAVVDLVGPPEVAAPNGVRAAVEAAVAETAAALQLGRTLLPDGNDAGALIAGQVALGEVVTDGGTEPVPRGEWWDAAALAVLGTLVLFVAMNTMGGGSGLAELRELGIVARLRASRASPLALAAGFGLALASYALVVAVLVLGTGRLAFGITWRSWGALAVVVVVLALVAGALGVLTGTLLPSPEAGTTVAGPAGFLLGMLGGCLWPLEFVGPALDRIGHLTPHAWAVEALRETAIGGGGLDDVAAQLAVLVAFAGGLVLLGGWRLHRIGARA